MAFRSRTFVTYPVSIRYRHVVIRTVIDKAAAHQHFERPIQCFCQSCVICKFSFCQKVNIFPASGSDEHTYLYVSNLG